MQWCRSSTLPRNCITPGNWKHQFFIKYNASPFSGPKLLLWMCDSLFGWFIIINCYALNQLLNHCSDIAVLIQTILTQGPFTGFFGNCQLHHMVSISGQSAQFVSVSEQFEQTLSTDEDCEMRLKAQLVCKKKRVAVIWSRVFGYMWILIFLFGPILAKYLAL